MIIEVNGEFYVVIDHSIEHMLIEKIREQEIIEAMESALPEESNTGMGRMIYRHKGLTVVVNEETEQVITVYRAKK